MSEYSNNPEINRVTYKAFTGLKEVPQGLVVTGIKPSQLYTTQTWIDIKKVKSALNKKADPDDTYPTNGYFHIDTYGRLKLILGDGNTKALVAWTRGLRVQFTVEGPLPSGIRYYPLSKLRNSYSDLFTDFNYR